MTLSALEQRIHDAIDWDFVDVFRGEDEPGYPTPEALVAVIARAVRGDVA